MTKFEHTLHLNVSRQSSPGEFVTVHWFASSRLDFTVDTG